MTTNTEITFGLLFAGAAFIFGLLAFLGSRETKNKKEGEWRGGVNTKLDQIVTGNTEMKAQVQYLTDEMGKMHTRLSVLEDQHNGNHRGRSKAEE